MRKLLFQNILTKIGKMSLNFLTVVLVVAVVILSTSVMSFELDIIEAGATVAASAGDVSSAGQDASSSPFGVATTLKIRNHSKWPLRLENVFPNSGVIQSTISEVMPGYMEIMHMHKTANTATGTAGTAAWKINNETLVVMWSVPYSRDLHSNWLAVGFLKSEHKADTFDDMYSGPQNFFARQEYNSQAGPVNYKIDDIEVQGTMGNDNKPDIVIDVRPRNETNLADRKN